MGNDISFIHVVDNAMKSAAFQRFGTFFDLTNQNKDLVFQPYRVTQRKIAEKRGESSVEFLSLWRTRITPDWSRQRTSVARDGISMKYSDSQKTSIVTVKAVPVTLDYELRFWSKDLDSTTEAVESYIKWFQDFPNLIVMYNGLYEMDMYMKFGAIVDESEYNIYDKGLYYVTQLPVSLEGWVMTTVDTPTILTIILDLYLREGTSPDYRDTFLTEYVITADS